MVPARRPPRPRAAWPDEELGSAHNRVADGPRSRTKGPFGKRAAGDGRPVGAIPVTPVGHGPARFFEAAAADLVILTLRCAALPGTFRAACSRLSSRPSAHR